MKPTKFAVLVFLLSIISLSFIACSKNNSEGKGRLQVYLSDDPANYDAVFLDVKDIQINVSEDSSGGWQSLNNVSYGTYDLLKLVNDDDTLLADAEIPTGTIHQVRLVLGDQNFVKVNGDMIPLVTPSAQQSGLKLNIQQQINAGVLYKLLLDFDAARSIHQTGNGTYMLKPVIRTVFEAIGGSIKGVVLPDTLTTAVYAIQGPDTIATTFAGSNGGFLIKGLSAGTYSVHFVPGNINFTSQAIDNVNVITGNVTVMDTVTLH